MANVCDSAVLTVIKKSEKRTLVVGESRSAVSEALVTLGGQQGSMIVIVVGFSKVDSPLALEVVCGALIGR